MKYSILRCWEFLFYYYSNIFYNHSRFLLLIFRFSKGTWTVSSTQTMPGWRQLFITSMMSKTLLRNFYWRLVFCAMLLENIIISLKGNQLNSGSLLPYYQNNKLSQPILSHRKLFNILKWNFPSGVSTWRCNFQQKRKT